MKMSDEPVKITKIEVKSTDFKDRTSGGNGDRASERTSDRNGDRASDRSTAPSKRKIDKYGRYRDDNDRMPKGRRYTNGYNYVPVRHSSITPHATDVIDNDSAVKSTILANNEKDKEEIIRLQNKFEGGEQRNKRIFGVLARTLCNFKQDDQVRSTTEKALGRKQLEERIEIKKQEEMAKLEFELDGPEKSVKSFIRHSETNPEDWTKFTNVFKNRIVRVTETRPPIFYKPKQVDSGSADMDDTAAGADTEAPSTTAPTETETTADNSTAQANSANDKLEESSAEK